MQESGMTTGGHRRSESAHSAKIESLVEALGVGDTSNEGRGAASPELPADAAARISQERRLGNSSVTGGPAALAGQDEYGRPAGQGLSAGHATTGQALTDGHSTIDASTQHGGTGMHPHFADAAGGGSAAAHCDKKASDSSPSASSHEVENEKMAAAAGAAGEVDAKPAAVTNGSRGPSGPGTGRFDPLAFRQYGFFAPELAPMRKIIFKGYFPFLILLGVLVVWGFLSIYWASLYETHPDRLTAFVVNGDASGGIIGDAITRAILDSANPSNPQRLGWQERPASDFPNGDTDFEYDVSTSRAAWLIVHVMDDATARLQTARNSQNSSWDPTQVVRLFYSQSRNYQAVSAFVLQPALQVLQPAIAQLNGELAQSYLSRVSSLATVQNMATTAPQLIAGPVSMSEVNTRRLGSYVIVATTFVGLIYLLILSFNVAMTLFGLRQPIQPYLKLRSLMVMRYSLFIFGCLTCSLSFATLNLPYLKPSGFANFDGNPARGFFAFFAFMFLGTTVLGLVIECFLGFLGQKFIGFGLLFFIVINVSVSNYPPEMLNRFFLYAKGMPFYVLKESFLITTEDASRHIDLLLNWGILMAWLVVCGGTLPLWIWYEQRNAIKARRAQITQKQTQESELIEQGRKSMMTSRANSISGGPGSTHAAYINGSRRTSPDHEALELRHSHQSERAEEMQDSDVAQARHVSTRTPTPLGLGRAH